MSAEVINFDAGGRVKVSTDDGFLKLANRLIEEMCTIDLNGRQFRLVHAVVRLTYGWKQKLVTFDRHEMSDLTGIKADEVSRLKNALVRSQVLIEVGKKIGVNPFVSEWESPQKRKTKTVQSDSKTVQSHSEEKGQNCAISQEKLCNRTGKTVQSHSKTALPSLHLKDKKDNLNILSDHASLESDDSKLISRPDSVVQSKNGKHWGTQIDLDSAKHVFDCVSGRTMDTREPNWAAWANEFRLMRERDHRKPEHIAQLFKFANEHYFWSTVVLSPANLRKNWVKIAAQFTADRNSTRGDTRTIQERLSDTSWADGL